MAALSLPPRLSSASVMSHLQDNWINSIQSKKLTDTETVKHHLTPAEMGQCWMRLCREGPVNARLIHLWIREFKKPSSSFNDLNLWSFRAELFYLSSHSDWCTAHVHVCMCMSICKSVHKRLHNLCGAAILQPSQPSRLINSLWMWMNY